MVKTENLIGYTQREDYEALTGRNLSKFFSYSYFYTVIQSKILFLIIMIITFTSSSGSSSSPIFLMSLSHAIYLGYKHFLGATNKYTAFDFRS